MTDVFEILEGRILNQFSESTNLLALLEAIYTQLQDTQDMLEALRDDRYIDTAEGVWLGDPFCSLWDLDFCVRKRYNIYLM